MTLPSKRGFAAGFALLLFLISAIVANRGGIRLSFDSYYYVEYGKEFRQHAPTSFGSAWPYGWPLLGAGMGLFGLSSYQGLLTLSVLSIAGLVVLASFSLPWERLGFLPGALLLAAVASLPILSALVAGALSEIPFAVIFLGFALSLARWPKPWAILAACALAFAAFAVRYAGGLLLILLVVWIAFNLKPLRAAGSLRLSVVAAAFTCAAAAGLLLWNYTSVGMISGHPRGNGVPPGQWPGIAADFGWSLPAALGGLGVRNILGFSTHLRVPLGLVFLFSVIFFALHAWWRGNSIERRALGATTAGYAIGLVALRCQGEFDPLYNARMFVPLLFPLVLLAAWTLPRALLLALGSSLLVVNAAFNLRGASLEIGADVQAACPIVRTARPDETIAVNDPALTLAARVNNRVVRAWPEEDVSSLLHHRFIVIAAPPLDRTGRSGSIPLEWTRTRDRLLQSGRCSSRVNTSGLIVLERTGPAP